MSSHLSSTSALERSMSVLRAMHELTKVRDSTSSIEYVLDQMIATLDAERAFVSYEEPDGQQIIVARNFENAAAAGREFELGRPIVHYVYATGEPTFTTQVQGDEAGGARVDRPSGGGRTKTVAWLPLRMHGRPFGVLYMDTTRRQCPFGEDDRVFLEALADQAALAILNSRLHRDAIRDSLTGLVIHRHFDVRLGEEVSRALRWKRPLSLLMLDIDDFKLVNDRHGHTMGNNVLRTLSSVLRVVLRESDVPGRAPGSDAGVDLAGRFGGDEFEVLLPDTGRDGARIVGERLLEAVRGLRFGDAGDIQITVSLGISTCPDDARDGEELLLKADEALYIAKRSGRDRLAFSGGGALAAAVRAGRAAAPPPQAPPELPLSREARRIVRMISHLFAGGLDRGPMLGVALRQTAEAIGSERGLVLLAGEGTPLRPAAAFGLATADYDRPELEEVRSLVADVFRSGVARIARNDARGATAAPLPTLLAIPIRARAGVRGVLYLEHAESGRPLTEDDVNLVTTLAGRLCAGTEASPALEGGRA